MAAMTSDYSPDAFRGERRNATVRIKALIFDFDGLILDTETPDYQVWKNIYREHGFELPDEEWGKIIGGLGLSNFDAAEHLSLLLQGRLDSVSLRDRHRSENYALIHTQPILPGVMNYIHDAKRLGLKLAIASSSPHSWVDTHAQRLGIFEYFDKIICADDIAVGRTKPNPDLFLSALNQLQVQKEEAVVFEDVEIEIASVLLGQAADFDREMVDNRAVFILKRTARCLASVRIVRETVGEEPSDLGQKDRRVIN